MGIKPVFSGLDFESDVFIDTQLNEKGQNVSKIQNNPMYSISVWSQQGPFWYGKYPNSCMSATLYVFQSDVSQLRFNF